MKVLAGGLFGPGHGGGGEETGGGWGLSQAVLGDGGRRGSGIRSTGGSCSGKDQLAIFSSALYGIGSPGLGGLEQS